MGIYTYSLKQLVSRRREIKTWEIIMCSYVTSIPGQSFVTSSFKNFYNKIVDLSKHKLISSSDTFVITTDDEPRTEKSETEGVLEPYTLKGSLSTESLMVSSPEIKATPTGVPVFVLYDGANPNWNSKPPECEIVGDNASTNTLSKVFPRELELIVHGDYTTNMSKLVTFLDRLVKSKEIRRYQLGTLEKESPLTKETLIANLLRNIGLAGRQNVRQAKTRIMSHIHIKPYIQMYYSREMSKELLLFGDAEIQTVRTLSVKQFNDRYNSMLPFLGSGENSQSALAYFYGFNTYLQTLTMGELVALSN